MFAMFTVYPTCFFVFAHSSVDTQSRGANPARQRKANSTPSPLIMFCMSKACERSRTDTHRQRTNSKGDPLFFHPNSSLSYYLLPTRVLHETLVRTHFLVGNILNYLFSTSTLMSFKTGDIVHHLNEHIPYSFKKARCALFI